MQLVTNILFASVDSSESEELRALGESCVMRFNTDYDGGMCCMMALMGSQRRFEHILLLRRGHQSFFREDFLGKHMLSSDLGVHNKGRWNTLMGSNFFRNNDGPASANVATS